MRLPTFSSLLCLAGLASVPVTAYEGDPDIKSIPVGSCLLTSMRCLGTNYPGQLASNPQFFSGMTPCDNCGLVPVPRATLAHVFGVKKRPC